jgi:hypothetical protein
MKIVSGTSGIAILNAELLNRFNFHQAKAKRYHFHLISFHSFKIA